MPPLDRQPVGKCVRCGSQVENFGGVKYEGRIFHLRCAIVHIFKLCMRQP